MSNPHDDPIPVRAGPAARMGALWWTFLLRGLAFAAFGLFALLRPGASLLALVWIIGAYLILDGLVGLLASDKSQGGRRMTRALIGVGIGAAALLAPGLTERVLIVLLALWLIWLGVDLFISGREISRLTGDDATLRNIGAALTLLGAATLIWNGVGEALVAWPLGFSALGVGAALIYTALLLRRIRNRLTPV